MMRAFRLVTVTAAVTVIAAACGMPGKSTPTGVTIPVTGKLVGLSTPGFPGDLATFQNVAAEARIHPTIASWYTPLGLRFKASEAAEVSGRGILPLLEIDTGTTPVKDIADGRWDGFFADPVAGRRL